MILVEYAVHFSRLTRRFARKNGADQPDDGVAASEAAGMHGRDTEGPAEERACHRQGIVTYGPGNTRVAVAVRRRSAYFHPPGL